LSCKREEFSSSGIRLHKEIEAQKVLIYAEKADLSISLPHRAAFRGYGC